MTLVLTHLSRAGVVMAADTAVTYPKPGDGEKGRRTERKLYIADHIPAVIGFWGSLDGFAELLSEFIEENDNVDDLQEFANLLEDKLREVTDPIDGVGKHPEGTLGCHVAGLEMHEGELTPSFYHVHNGLNTSVDVDQPELVNAVPEYPPSELVQLFNDDDDEDDYVMIRNGDYELYAILFGELGELLRDINENRIDGLEKYTDLRIPKSDDLESIEEYLSFQIQTMTTIYEMSTWRIEEGERIDAHIGGNINTVKIDCSGTVEESTFRNLGIEK